MPVYKDTPANRKLDRVGKEWGKKSQGSKKDDMEGFLSGLPEPAKKPKKTRDKKKPAAKKVAPKKEKKKVPKKVARKSAPKTDPKDDEPFSASSQTANKKMITDMLKGKDTEVSNLAALMAKAGIKYS